MKPVITLFRTVYSPADIQTVGLPEICISGRSNVGKSSLINRLANRRNLARISRIPGKTQSINYYLVGSNSYLVDLPGYGYAKVPKSSKKLFAELVKSYLNGRQELKGIIQLLDARHGLVGGDYDMLEWIKMWGGRVLYVFTKADKLSSGGRIKMKKKFEHVFNTEHIVMFSAKTGIGTESIWLWITETFCMAKSNTIL